MVLTTVLWRWTILTISLKLASSNTSMTLILTDALDLLALAFLTVGFIALWHLRRRREKRTQPAKTLPATQMQASNRSGQRRGMDIAPPLVMAVPVLVLLLVWFGGVMSPGLSTSPGLSLIQPGVLTVGTTTSFPQQTYTDPKTHKAAGFDTDLITAIAQQMGLQVKIVPMDFVQLIPNLNSRKVDVVIAAYPLKDLASSVQSVPYLAPREIVLGSARNTASFQFKKLSDLCGHTVGVQKDSVEDITLRNINCNKDLTITIKELPDADAVAHALAHGQVDATYQDSPTSVYYMTSFPGSFIPLGKMKGTEEGILIRGGNSGIFNAVQAAFHRVVQDNMYNMLLTKWGLTNDKLPS